MWCCRYGVWCQFLVVFYLLGVNKRGLVILLGGREREGQRAGRGVVDGAAASCVEPLLGVMILIWCFVCGVWLVL